MIMKKCFSTVAGNTNDFREIVILCDIDIIHPYGRSNIYIHLHFIIIIRRLNK